MNDSDPDSPRRKRRPRFDLDADFDFDLGQPPPASAETSGEGFTLRVDEPPPQRSRRTRERVQGRKDGLKPVRRPRSPKQPGKPTPEMLARVLYAIPGVAVLIVATVAGGVVFAAVTALLACLTIYELCRVSAAANPFSYAAMLISVALIGAAYQWGMVEMMVILVASVPVIFVAMLTRADTGGALASSAVTVLAVLWIGLPLAHAVLLREIPEHGAALLVNVLVATFVCDTAAYIGGRSFGRRPLAAVISPNKTIEGLLFGIAGGALAFWFVGLYQDWLPGLDALIMGLVIAVVAPLGDLFESAVKRDLGVKDMGGLMGPHGGLLDRIDALLFTIPAGYYLAVVFLA